MPIVERTVMEHRVVPVITALPRAVTLWRVGTVISAPASPVEEATAPAKAPAPVSPNVRAREEDAMQCDV